MAEANPRIAQARARRGAEVVYQLAGEVFGGGQPADRLLTAYFREHRQFGSTDRRFIGDVFFSLFRWWGWLGLLPGADKLWEAVGEEPPWEQADWQRVLLTAHLLDASTLHPAAAAWQADLQVEQDLEGLEGRPLAERAAYLGTLWDLPAPSPSQLVPAWFYDQLAGADKDRLELMETFQRRPPVWLRAQTTDLNELLAELEADGVQVAPSPLLPLALRVDSPRANLRGLKAFRNGRFEFQDFASQMIGWACCAKSGERWWDVCAGAGGKSLQLASTMRGKGVVVATDVRAARLRELNHRARRARIPNISRRRWDGKSVPARDANFDGVLVDAPCSGSGVWRRNPDGRWTTGAETVAESAELQADILAIAARGVRPGGRLVYATCSLCDSENEQIVKAFLAANDEFALEEFEHPLSEEPCHGMFRVLPQAADSDASFIARLQRQEKK